MIPFEDIPDPAPSPEAQMIEQERKVQLYRALEKLSERDRYVMIQLYDGATLEELAMELNVTEAAIRGIRQRSLKRLKRWLSN